MPAKLIDAQKTLDAMVKDRRARAVQEVFDVADNERTVTVKNKIVAKLLSRASANASLENDSPSNQPDAVTVACGQSRRPGCRAHAQSNAGRGIDCHRGH